MCGAAVLVLLDVLIDLPQSEGALLQLSTLAYRSCGEELVSEVAFEVDQLFIGFWLVVVVADDGYNMRKIELVAEIGNQVLANNICF